MNNTILFEQIYKIAKNKRLSEFIRKRDRDDPNKIITVCDDPDLNLKKYLLYRDGSLVTGTGPMTADEVRAKAAELKKEYPYSKFRAVNKAA